MRIYVPATVELAKQWRAAGLVPAEVAAFAVTDEVVREVAGDDEENEYAATQLAAAASGELGAAPGRRIVVALDAAVTVGEGAEVALVEAVAWKRVAALLVEAAVSDDDDIELLWYAPAELDDLA